MIRILRYLILTAAFSAWGVDTAHAQKPLPRVLVLATGGTIAGEQRDPGTQEPYEIRKTAGEIVALVPEARRYARVETEQFANIPSTAVTPAQWLLLAKRINELLREQKDLAGIVVTHGTARLEETAFFLHLAVQSDKPVVLVGAQRPATGISPDGPLNLLAAIRVAAAAESIGKGAMVVMDERVFSARDAEKIYARSGGFDAPEMGMMGVIAAHGVEYFYQPVRRHTFASEFDLVGVTDLPRVDIEYSYAGSVGPVKLESDVKGVVVVSTGMTPQERNYYERLHRQGIVVASTFPSGGQVGTPPPLGDSTTVVVVQRLSPVHARILLMLALTRTTDVREIQRMFTEY